MALHYIMTGAPCTGKSTLAAWLCRRLPQPVTGLRTFCTGRQGDGPRFSVQNLADGTVTPLEHPTDWDTAAAPVLLAALAQGQGTILVDEAAPPAATDTPWAWVLAQVLGSNRPVVLTAAEESLAEQAVSAYPENRCLCLDRTTPQQIRETLARGAACTAACGASVRLFREEKCFGPGPMELLELVGVPVRCTRRRPPWGWPTPKPGSCWGNWNANGALPCWNGARRHRRGRVAAYTPGLGSAAPLPRPAMGDRTGRPAGLCTVVRGFLKKKRAAKYVLQI